MAAEFFRPVLVRWARFDSAPPTAPTIDREAMFLTHARDKTQGAALILLLRTVRCRGCCSTLRAAVMSVAISSAALACRTLVCSGVKAADGSTIEVHLTNDLPVGVTGELHCSSFT